MPVSSSRNITVADDKFIRGKASYLAHDNSTVNWRWRLHIYVCILLEYSRRDSKQTAVNVRVIISERYLQGVSPANKWTCVCIKYTGWKYTKKKHCLLSVSSWKNTCGGSLCRVAGEIIKLSRRGFVESRGVGDRIILECRQHKNSRWCNSCSPQRLFTRFASAIKSNHGCRNTKY